MIEGHPHETYPTGGAVNDYFTAARCLEGLSLAEHMGDVNEYLPWLADAIGSERPEWCDECRRMIWPWEEPWEDEDYDA